MTDICPTIRRITDISKYDFLREIGFKNVKLRQMKGYFYYFSPFATATVNPYSVEKLKILSHPKFFSANHLCI